MTKLYEKNKLWFSLCWIFIYVIGSSAADYISEGIGFKKSATLVFHILMSAALFTVIKRLGIEKRSGLTRPEGGAKAYLFYLPLAAIMTVNLWRGLELRFSPAEAVAFAASMVFVGFIEEVIFRSFLFRAIYENEKPKLAVAISSLTFGIGHIVNLLSGERFFVTLLQVFYACAVGFLFTVILYKGKSILPCIIAHSFINATSTTAAEPSDTLLIVMSIFIIVVSTSYALWLWFKLSESKAAGFEF